ncbi:SAM hydrolase/SAM-dependent halogenase family protein [Imhoffiella purpurea]|uniref:SAM-dependent chlorinase/fluorinase n=1 Tax=Imhoffiella purpurea TaxID=1249627 RepID=W9V2U0_9GAMM|nr:SAM-dependent chlorinase/fluorinase [Imhoffiella purpurea]EXJ13654.1 hypothetical protein D779_3546 [Imhoffiella purpurea]
MWERIERILLVTDFGPGIYVGQMRARLDALVPDLPVIDLVQDLPLFRPDLAGYLLPGLVRDLPPASLCLCVVDPGVGGERDLVVARVEGSWYLAPDNGLLVPLLRRAADASLWRIGWRPGSMSPSFHGRDWFVPAAARIAHSEDLALSPVALDALVAADSPPDCSKVIYVDHFGNLMTGLELPGSTPLPLLQVGERRLPFARTFCEVESGQPFWYENALGLVEIAVNQGRADQLLGLRAGDALGPFVDRV